MKRQQAGTLMANWPPLCSAWANTTDPPLQVILPSCLSNNQDTFVIFGNRAAWYVQCLITASTWRVRKTSASCTKLAYAQKSCICHFSHKRLAVQRLTCREKVRFSTQTSCLEYAHSWCSLSVGGVVENNEGLKGWMQNIWIYSKGMKIRHPSLK